MTREKKIEGEDEADTRKQKKIREIKGREEKLGKNGKKLREREENETRGRSRHE